PLAFLLGLTLQKFRPGWIGEVTALGVVLLLVALAVGRIVSQSELASWFTFERPTLVWLLAGYGFLASVLPGWMLLDPRGYLSTFMKVGVVVLLGCGVVLMAPTLELPPVTVFAQGGGRVTRHRREERRASRRGGVARDGHSLDLRRATRHGGCSALCGPVYALVRGLIHLHGQ